MLRKVQKTLQPLNRTSQWCTVSSCRIWTYQKLKEARFYTLSVVLPYLARRKTNVIMSQSNFMSSVSPSITVTPADTALVDEKVAVEVTGLQNEQSITIHACLKEGKTVFESCCCYSADSRGTVNVRRSPSLSGSYTGISDMGLFTNMVPTQEQKLGVRLIKKDVSVPYVTELKVYDGHHTVESLHVGSQMPISSTVCHRWYQAPGVRRIPIRNGKLRGTLFLPPGPGPFPGVIDMFGTAGGLIEFRSALLASRGFVTLALAFFGYEDLTSELREVNLDYFMEAIDWFSSHEAVQPGGIGALGTSKGGEVSLLMAIHSSKIKAVADVSGQAFLTLTDMPYSKGVIKGVPFDFGGVQFGDNNSIIPANCWPYKKENIFNVWKSDAKVLIMVGDDDKNCGPQSLMDLRDMYPEERRENLQLVIYPGAGHLIEPPYTPYCRMSYHKVYDVNLIWGGLPEGHAAAQADSWSRILHHFRTHLPQSEEDLPVTSKL